MKGWIAVDLDGTLAEGLIRSDDTFDPYEIGPPIKPMVERVKNWLKAGEDVRVFTARLTPHPNDKQPRDIHKMIDAVHAWCLDHIGSLLPVTNVKDNQMKQLWDDRAISVEHNTGRVLGPEIPFGPTKRTTASVLREAAALFTYKNSLYKDNGKQVGEIMSSLHPNGVSLKNQYDNEFHHLYTLIIVKLTRFANAGLFTDGLDSNLALESLKDLVVYGAMLQRHMEKGMGE